MFSRFFKSPSSPESEPFLPALEEVLTLDDINITVPRRTAPLKTTLSHELKACIEILESAQRNNLPAPIKQLENWQRYQNALWLFSFIGLLAGGGITAYITWHLYDQSVGSLERLDDHLENQLQTLLNQKGTTPKELKDLRHQINELHDTINTKEWGESLSIVSGFCVYIGILGFLIIQLAKANDEYKEDKYKLHFLENSLTDPSDANRIINLAARLNIKVTDIPLEELIEKFKQAENELTKRQHPKWLTIWCLDQIKPADSDEPIFINNDVKGLILKRAGF